MPLRRKAEIWMKSAALKFSGCRKPSAKELGAGAADNGDRRIRSFSSLGQYGGE
jgi:hypothetical protein